MSERAPKPYTATDGKTRIAKGPSEHAAAIESAGQNIADALRSLPSADSWEGLRLAVKHHGQGTEAAGECIAEAIGHTLADAVDNAANELAGIGDAQRETAEAASAIAGALDSVAEAVAGAGNAQSEALSEFLAPAVDRLANEAAAAADKQAQALRDVGHSIRAGLERIADALQLRAA
ncbi:MAG: hypothetical protein JSS17_17850 [Proteobacteria bacterium]|nr:hypothetical protein [Pseudomonadota bacterium]